MPCWNAARTVDEAVESILGQSHSDLEVIAVDDGSSDDTLARLESWAAKDRRVTVRRGSHVGLVEALNRGLAACRAPYIARMDADDRMHPDRLAAQRDLLQQEAEIAVVGCLVAGFPPDGVREGFRIYLEWLNGLVTPETIAREIYIESPLAHPSAMMRRTWLEHVGGYQDHGWPEDYDLWLRLHLAGARFAKVAQVLLDWREHPDRATRTDSRYSVENFLRAKAYYLVRGPLADREAVFVWGAGQMGRRLSKHLVRNGATLAGFVDIDPDKIGRTRRGVPVMEPGSLMDAWRKAERPVLLAAVGSRGARGLIRARLAEMGLVEAQDWWAAA
jgi:glycosyltransferase involved in cell wall biosynthesis